jgi:hypothetical protein
MAKIPLLIWLFSFMSAYFVVAQENNAIGGWLDEAYELLESVDNYTAIFHRQVRVRDELKAQETILLKFKKPLSVYLKWIENPYKGRELLYVDGENNDLIKVHAPGLFSPVILNFDPRGSLLMRSSRHPITEIGIHYITRFISDEFRKGIDRGEIEVNYRGEEIVFGRKTMKIEGVFPQNSDGVYYCRRALLNIDLETRIPISIAVYDGANELFEYYGFENLILNAGLVKNDFDPKNKHYGF